MKKPYTSLKDVVEYIQKDDFRELLYIGTGLTSSEVEYLVVDIDWNKSYDEWGLSVKEKITQINNKINTSGVPKPTHIIFNLEKGSAHLEWQLDKPFKIADISYNKSYINRDEDEYATFQLDNLQKALCLIFDGDLSFYKSKARMRNPYYLPKENSENKIKIISNDTLYDFDKLYLDVMLNDRYFSYDEDTEWCESYPVLSPVAFSYLYLNDTSLKRYILNNTSISSSSNDNIDIRLDSISISNNKINKYNKIKDISEYNHKNDLLLYEGLRIIRENNGTISKEDLKSELKPIMYKYAEITNKNVLSDKRFDTKVSGIIKCAKKTYNNNCNSVVKGEKSRDTELSILKRELMMLSTTKNVHNNSSFDNKTIADKLGISVRTVQRHIKKDLNKCISDFITNFLSLFDKCKFEKIEEIITNWGINLNIDIINLILGKIKAILVKSKESFVKIFSLLHNNKSKSLRNKVIPNLFNRFIHKETYHYVRC